MQLAPYIQPGNRIIFATSALHNPEGAHGDKESSEQIKDPDLFNMLDGTPDYSGIAYYKVSKLAMLWVAFITAKQFPQLSELSFEPGFVSVTGLARQRPWITRMLFKFVLPYTSQTVTIDHAVSDYVCYAISNEYDGVTGEYLFNREKAEASERARNMDEDVKFWNLFCDICNTPELMYNQVVLKEYVSTYIMHSIPAS
ncbi:hypothetical protein BJV82DRAFT_573391 [Fennellomyces sp. T-0311]|nr:hypothetical protein BJV82DRAFT_573391 [Fennellomyces sp. T-0311]